MTKKSMTNSDGCLWVFITIVATVIGFGIIKIVSGLQDIPALLLAIILAIFITIKLLGRPSGRMMIRQSLFLLVFFFGIKFIGGIFVSIIKTLTTENVKFSKEEIVTNDILIEENDTIPLYTSMRSWKDNLGNSFYGALSVRQRDYIKLQYSTKSFEPYSNQNFWGELYSYIEKKDAPSLDLVMTTFTRINAEKQLNQMEFAEMVVSCIQDIPYSFVFQEACLPANNYEDSIKDILEDCPECCIGNVPYGIQNPISFIKNLKGDCDTRTVLIYSILKHFDYDVAILNSNFYRHSILGLNIPGSGKTKLYKGKKYILWETTAKYFSAGVLPSNFKDIRHWNVVLTSK
tara:strand:- start:184 stop:1221 length:1038 start_codon:yes stop_codon:yes gene_type:complete